ncbi:MAG: DUF3619 family protein [Rhodocyclaceae bacterium]|nr:DUF3619 family protein [Rhodocyclaceae bacterium]
MSAADLDRLAHRLGRQLGRGGLSPYQARRLAEARERALNMVAGGYWRRLVGWSAAPALPLALVATLLVVVVAGLVPGTDDQASQEVAEVQPFTVDYGLLVDDLPIDAYLDEGFRQWLATRADS